jgi:hypothetical protein
VLTKEQKQEIAQEVLGSSMGPIELTLLGEEYGLEDSFLYADDIDLQVALIAEEEEVWRCDSCSWWVELHELHNDICSDCYALDNDK